MSYLVGCQIGSLGWLPGLKSRFNCKVSCRLFREVLVLVERGWVGWGERLKENTDGEDINPSIVT